MRAIDMLRKDINSLKCKESRLEAQNMLLQVALDELGTNDPPVGVEVDNEIDISPTSSFSVSIKLTYYISRDAAKLQTTAW